MFELIQAITDADVLLALEPEELGAKLLFLLRKRSFQRNMFLPGKPEGEQEFRAISCTRRHIEPFPQVLIHF